MHLYVLTNTVNGKRYVGQTVGRVTRRISSHKISPQPIGHAIRKYGIENFDLKTIKATSLENLNALEELAIKVLESRYTHHGYNIKRGGNNQTGQKPTPEAIEKVRAALKGRKRPPDVCAKISAAQVGKKKSATQVDKHRLKLIGRKLTKDHRKAISEGNKGRVVSAETRAKISEANSGKKRTPEMNEANRLRATGTKHSEETKVMMSLTRKGRKLPPRTPEQIAKMSEALKGKPWSAARRSAHERKKA